MDLLCLLKAGMKRGLQTSISNKIETVLVTMLIKYLKLLYTLRDLWVSRLHLKVHIMCAVPCDYCRCDDHEDEIFPEFEIMT